MWILGRTPLAWLAVAAAVWSCSGGEPSPASRAATQAAAAAKRPANPVEARLHAMVGAVAANKATGAMPVQVKFDLRQRPTVAQPVEIDLMIVPLSGSLDRISGKVEADDGLDVVDGAQIPAMDRPVEGVPIEHLIKVVPKHEGIFTFSAIVTVESAGQSSTETFSAPLIAGSGMPDLPPRSATKPAKTAAAQ